jgi:hypothetical protein
MPEAITYPGARRPDRRRFVDSNGLAIATYEWGAEDAPPLMLAHGGMDFAGTFDSFAPLGVVALMGLLAPLRMVALLSWIPWAGSRIGVEMAGAWPVALGQAWVNAAIGLSGLASGVYLGA